MKEIDIKKATQDELVWFAANVMGLDGVTAMMSADSIRAKIKKAGYDKSNIQAQDDEEKIIAKEVAVKADLAEVVDPNPEAEPEIDPVKAKAIARRNEVSGKNDPVIKIFVPKQHGQSGSSAIPVAVNGTLILIPREQECEVALRYVHALINAVSTEYDMDEHGNSTPRDVQLYPFNIIEGREHLA